MKTTCLLFLSISWATLMHGTDYAVPESVLCPLPWGEGIGHAVPELVVRPLPWGEGIGHAVPESVLCPLPWGEGMGHAVPELLLCPLPWGEGMGHAVPELVLCPLPWGEGVPRPAFSPAGAGRVRGDWGLASQPTSSESSANTAGGKASDEQRDHGRAPDTNHPPSRASLTKVNRPKPKFL